MALLLIRHGETPLNVARVLQPPDTPLSAHGRAQARALAQRLASDARDGVPPVGAIVSSDLARALETAQAIAQACGLAVATSALLQERNFGDLRGRAYDSLGHDPIASDEAPPGGESGAVFAARCDAAWAWLLTQRPAQGALVVVTHGLVLRQWLAHPRVQRPDGLALPEHLANTALSLVQGTPPHRVQRLACTAHLHGLGDDAAALVGG
ncbi:histidine phosphatase family protein [Ideonella sp. DXS22W]|uniref:Histidine phosphatase family protein n=1 Tax=Pseudaquabacterium inlustre TaxID=2984192 RepID=A0ABU9CC00_9BURK